MSYSKGSFTIDEIEFIQGATIRVLVAVTNGELDLNLLARQELAHRGLDQNGVWVGFERARELQAEIDFDRRLREESIAAKPQIR